MSLAHGTSLVKDGLVLHYDMNNTQKSWRGKPTVNLVTNTPTQSGWMGSYTLVDSSTKTFLITTSLDTAPGSAWRTWYWDVSSYVGQTITISGHVEFVSQTNATFSSIAIGQGNTGAFPVHIEGSDPADKVSTTIKPTTRTFMSWTGVINSTGIVGFTQWINNVTVNGGNSVLKISNVQIEVNSFATPFVDGTRSNTQTIIDLTRKNTLTANSLTYNSDNTFTFDGVANSFISFPYTQAAPNNFTVAAWIYHKSHSTDGNVGDIIVMPYSSYNAWIFSLVGTNSILQLRHHNVTTSSNSYNITSSSGLNLNTWYYVAATDNGTDVKLYVNDTNVATIGSAASTTSGSMFCRIGAWDGIPSNYFHGEIPCVQIYDRALSASEVKQNYESVRGRYGI